MAAAGAATSAAAASAAAPAAAQAAKAAAAGSGAIHFASTSGEVEYAAGAHLANPISGFGGSDKIDFAHVAFAAGDHAVDNAGMVSIETSAGKTVATFKVSGTYTSSNFKAGKDASGHVLVAYVAPAAPADGWAVIGSPADLLGGYAPEFAEPPWMRESDLSMLHSGSALGSSAGTDPGVYGFPYERDGSVGGMSYAGAVGHGGPGCGSSGTGS